MRQNFFPAIRLTIVCIVFFVIIYPFVIWLAAKASTNHGEGETVTVNNKVVGYKLEGQNFSDDKYFSVQTISPSTAIDETGKNVLTELIKKDSNFLEQPVPGNAVTLEYNCNIPADNISRSYVLHTRGYYTHSWNFKGSPKVAFLKGLKKPDAFPAYSLQLYKKFVNTNMASLAAK